MDYKEGMFVTRHVNKTLWYKHQCGAKLKITRIADTSYTLDDGTTWSKPYMDKYFKPYSPIRIGGE